MRYNQMSTVYSQRATTPYKLELGPTACYNQGRVGAREHVTGVTLNSLPGGAMQRCWAA
jgi:hypothetical protein